MAHRLDNLPQELLHYIVRLLKYDVLTLRSLCLTSRCLSHEAQLHLYADIRVISSRHYRRDRTCIDFESSKKFFNTIVIHNPSLARHVRCFVYNTYFLQAASTLDLVLRGLQLMTNIKILEFIPVDDEHVPTNPFQGCTFQLTHFHCNFNIASEFFSSQPTLQSLDLEKSIEMPSFKLIPDLGTLRVEYWEDVAKFLPGRCIRHLEFAGVLPDEPSFAVATKLRNLTVLVLDLPVTLQPDGIENMIPYLTQLRLLSVTGGSLFRRLNLVPEIMLALQDLEILIYSRPFYYDLRKIDTSEDHLHMVSIWFQKMSKLKAAYLQTFGSYGPAGLYDRWLANDTRPTEIWGEEVLPSHGRYYSYAEEYEFSSVLS